MEHSHSRQGFAEDEAGQAAKLTAGAQGLIAEAKRLSELKKTDVDPLSLAKRKEDYKDGK